jgi:adenylate kinase
MSNGGSLYIFMGPPGSGKGTVARECVRRLGYASLSTGNLCREHIGNKTEIGKEIDLIVKSGKLISDELVTLLVGEWLSGTVDRYQKIILDGYPRTEQQVVLFFNLLRARYPCIKARVIKFDVGDETAVGRLSNRLICQNNACQAVYSRVQSYGCVPIRVGVCDVCASPLTQRLDDKPEVIRDRLIVYRQHDVSHVFKNMGLPVHVVCADGSLNEVLGCFMRVVKCDDVV